MNDTRPPTPPAFPGGTRVRDDLLFRLDRKVAGSEFWFGAQAERDPLADLSSYYGLHPALVLLMRRLGGDTGDSDVHRFIVDVVAAVPPGSATVDAVRLWSLWALETVPDGLIRAVEGTAAHAPAQAVYRLIDASRSEAPGGDRWAAARAELDDDGTAGFVAAILALAHAPEDKPDAAAEAARLWGEAVKSQAEVAFGWTAAMQENFLDRSMKLHDIVAAELPPIPATDFEAWYADYREAMAAAVRQCPDLQELKARAEEANHVGTLARLEWLDVARAALVSCVAVAVPVDGTSAS